MGTVIDDFMFTAADGTTDVRRAEVVAERPDGGVTMAVLNEQGTRDGTSMFSAVTALKVLGPPADPVGSSVSGADWPALATLVKSIDPANVVAEANVFDTGAVKIKLRAILTVHAVHASPYFNACTLFSQAWEEELSSVTLAVGWMGRWLHHRQWATYRSGEPSVHSQWRAVTTGSRRLTARTAKASSKTIRLCENMAWTW